MLRALGSGQDATLPVTGKERRNLLGDAGAGPDGRTCAAEPFGLDGACCSPAPRQPQRLLLTAGRAAPPAADGWDG